MHFIQSNKSTTIAIMTILLLSVFELNPISLYIDNIEQFETPLYELIKLCLIPSLSLLLLFILLIKFLPDSEIQHRIAVSLAIFSLLFWFQSNVLLWDYGILDGRSIDWTKNTWRGWVDGLMG